MSKGTIASRKVNAFVSRVTINESGDNVYHVSRDADGEYAIEDKNGDCIIFIGHSERALRIATAIEDLASANGE